MNNALPSFLDVHRGTLVVTDLGTQSIVKFFDETGTDSYKYRRAMTLEANPRSPRRGAISYMSGVYIDDELNMLIADAKGRSLQVRFFCLRL
ncbi:hypothetical protein OESDEN_23421 [Oesophagostomum dentatum]|uniref:Adipocyte plasma membrane-associated protein n=1 Tax=Oesophagostomum dentatum TaxID=61180 RepID=A0A0B1RWA6_OESDE|nr:hypothetical protein OESDEN_23421 [Oesophagostomum dentatum]